MEADQKEDRQANFSGEITSSYDDCLAQAILRKAFGVQNETKSEQALDHITKKNVI